MDTQTQSFPLPQTQQRTLARLHGRVNMGGTRDPHTDVRTRAVLTRRPNDLHLSIRADADRTQEEREYAVRDLDQLFADTWEVALRLPGTTISVQVVFQTTYREVQLTPQLRQTLDQRRVVFDPTVQVTAGQRDPQGAPHALLFHHGNWRCDGKLPAGAPGPEGPYSFPTGHTLVILPETPDPRAAGRPRRPPRAQGIWI